MNELLRNLKNFLAAGDASRDYLLSRAEVQLLVDEIERLRQGTLKVYSFADIRDEARRMRDEKLKRAATTEAP